MRDKAIRAISQVALLTLEALRNAWHGLRKSSEEKTKIRRSACMSHIKKTEIIAMSSASSTSWRIKALREDAGRRAMGGRLSAATLPRPRRRRALPTRRLQALRIFLLRSSRPRLRPPYLHSRLRRPPRVISRVPRRQLPQLRQHQQSPRSRPRQRSRLSRHRVQPVRQQAPLLATVLMLTTYRISPPSVRSFSSLHMAPRKTLA